MPSGPVLDVPSPNYSDADKLAVFNQLNKDRANCGFGKLAQNQLIDVAAQGHADYLKINHATGHDQLAGRDGFTGVDPDARLKAAGVSYSKGMEVISYTGTGTFFARPNANGLPAETINDLSAVNNLRKLYASTYHLSGAMQPFKEVGIGVSITNNDDPSTNTTARLKNLVIDLEQNPNSSEQILEPSTVLSFPCEGTEGLMPQYGPENPEAFSYLFNDYGFVRGQPIYFRSGPGTSIAITSSRVAPVGGVELGTVQLTYSNDPNKAKNFLRANEVFIVPVKPLLDNTTYDVVVTGTNSGLVSSSNPSGSFNRSFKFKTGTFTSE